jgi:hypothetical protein
MKLFVMQHLKVNSVAWVREQTISTEQQLLGGEVSANFYGQKVSRGQSNGPHGRVLGFLDRNLYFIFQVTHEAERMPFQINYFSEKLLAPAIQP